MKLRGLSRNGRRRGLVTALLWLVAVAAGRASPAVLFESAPGQVQIAAANATAAQPVLSAAQSVWEALRDPFDLPAAFSSPVFVRVVPATDWNGAAPFRVTVEPAGLVTLWLRGGDTADAVMRRGLVQALLLRKAVELHGVSARLTVPLWLEVGATGWWRAAENGSQLDGLKRQAEHVAAPALTTLLHWRRGEPETADLAVGAYWLMVFLQAESNRRAEWHRFVAAVLGGADADGALRGIYAGAAADGSAAELWWLTGWHHHRRLLSLPQLSAADSRAQVADAVRQVWRRNGTEVVVAPEEWLALAQTAEARRAFAQAASRLESRAPGLHPFYRNAALSLARLMAAAARAQAKEFHRAREQFAADWRDASELEAASARALDALEAK